METKENVFKAVRDMAEAGVADELPMPFGQRLRDADVKKHRAVEDAVTSLLDQGLMLTEEEKQWAIAMKNKMEIIREEEQKKREHVKTLYVRPINEEDKQVKDEHED